MSARASSPSSTMAWRGSAVALSVGFPARRRARRRIRPARRAVRRPHRAVAVVWRVDPPVGDSGSALMPVRLGGVCCGALEARVHQGLPAGAGHSGLLAHPRLAFPPPCAAACGRGAPRHRPTLTLRSEPSRRDARGQPIAGPADPIRDGATNCTRSAPSPLCWVGNRGPMEQTLQPKACGMSDYDTDLVLWSREQAELLWRMAAGERVNDRVDWVELAEEMEFPWAGATGGNCAGVFRSFCGN